MSKKKPINPEDQYVVWSTKMSPLMDNLGERVIEYLGTNKYDFAQQAIAEKILTNVPAGTEVPDQLWRLIRDFQHTAGWHKCFTMGDPGDVLDIYAAVYFVRNPKKDGMRALLIREPYFGEWQMTTDNTAIFEFCASHTFPLYRRFRLIGSEEECKNIVETLDILARQWEQNNCHYLDDFQDNRRSEWGKAQHTVPLVRKMHKDIDSPSLFND